MDYVTTSTGQPDIYTSPTGALRDSQTGKPRYDLIHPLFLKRLAFLLSRGAEKYGENNWRKGQETDRTVASMLRHIYAYIEAAELGEEGDKEDHLAAIAFNVMSLMVVEDGIREGRYPQALQTIEARQPFFQAPPSETYAVGIGSAVAIGSLADAVRDAFSGFLSALQPTDADINQQLADAAEEDDDDDDCCDYCCDDDDDDDDDDEEEVEIEPGVNEPTVLRKVLLAEPSPIEESGTIDLANLNEPVAWVLPFAQADLTVVSLKQPAAPFGYRLVPIEYELIPYRDGWLPENFPCDCPSCQLIRRYYPVVTRPFGQKTTYGVVSYPLPVRLGGGGFLTEKFSEEDHLAYRAFLESYNDRYEDTSYSY
jgi:Domain of unknown function (DUF5664)